MQVSKRAKVLVASEIDLRANPGERWIRIERSPNLPDGVDDLAFGFEEVDGALVCRGVVLRMADRPGGTVMREIPLATLEDEARSASGLLLDSKPRITAAPGAGRAGHPEPFLRQVYELWRFAERRHPRRPIAWMHEQGLPAPLRPQNVETVRTWVRQARQLVNDPRRAS